MATVRDARLPDGILGLQGSGEVAAARDWTGHLYLPSIPARRVPVLAIPYFAWDNRAAGAMRVWLPVVAPVPPAGGPERQAEVSVSFAHSNSQPQGINDGFEPKGSSDQPAALCHWWPHKNQTEWVQYSWKTPVTLARTQVYWFDDTGRGACRLPASWRIESLVGQEWQPVAASGDYPIKADAWCAVAFQPVTTTALRLVVQLQEQWAAGVHEWRVESADEP